MGEAFTYFGSRRWEVCYQIPLAKIYEVNEWGRNATSSANSDSDQSASNQGNSPPFIERECTYLRFPDGRYKVGQH